ncbi:MAG: peptide deformylase [Patescibacteria group bacterium]
MPIIDRKDPILRQTAAEIPLEKIGSKEVLKIIAEMKSELSKQSDGVAIAAPQIGHSVRIFVISGRTLDMLEKEDGDKDFKDTTKTPDKVFINPKIIKASRKKMPMEEGCLSVRYLYGKVKRSEKATIEAYNETGKKFVLSGTGLLAQIFQHETDHLNGILFIDTATDVIDMPPKHKTEN